MFANMDSDEPPAKTSRKRSSSSTVLALGHASSDRASQVARTATLPEHAKDELIGAVLENIVGRLAQNGKMEDLVQRMGTAVAEQIRIDELAQRLATEYASDISARLPAAIFAQMGDRARKPLDDRRDA
jgi:hypothetical protein